MLLGSGEVQEVLPALHQAALHWAQPLHSHQVMLHLPTSTGYASPTGSTGKGSPAFTTANLEGSW